MIRNIQFIYLNIFAFALTVAEFLLQTQMNAVKSEIQVTMPLLKHTESPSNSLRGQRAEVWLWSRKMPRVKPICYNELKMSMM